MNDKIGKIPKIGNKNFALREIDRIANDKKSHVMLIDENKWLRLKMTVISTIAKRGIKCKSANRIGTS